MDYTNRLLVWVEPDIIDRARNASAATGIMLREIAERALAGEVERMEAEYGKFPQRANRRLKTGPAPGGRRAPMVAAE
jgi:hypothetical protein